MVKLITDFIAFLNSEKLNSESIEAYKKNILKFREFLLEKNTGFLNVKKGDIFDYINKLKDDGFRNNSINQKISTLRLFYSYLAKEEKVLDPTLGIANLKIESTDKKYSIEEIKRLVDFLKNDESLDPTTRMVAMLIIYLGIKGATVAALSLDDLFIDSGIIYIKIKERIELQKINPALASVARDYLDYREKIKVKSSSLFLNNSQKPLTRVNVVYLIKRVADKLGLETRSLTMLTRSQKLLKDGPTIGERYTVLKEIDRDGVCELYKVRDNEDGFKIKLLFLYNIDKKNRIELERLKVDVNILKTIHHKNLVGIHDIDLLSENKIVVTREYHEFSYLSDYAGRIKLLDFIGVASGLLTGIQYLTKSKISDVIIDIKNIIIIKDKLEIIPKYLEWGPKLPTMNKRGKDTLKHTLSSFGILLYHLATGKNPPSYHRGVDVNAEDTDVNQISLQKKGKRTDTVPTSRLMGDRLELKKAREDFTEELINIIMDLIEEKRALKSDYIEEYLSRIQGVLPDFAKDEIDVTSLNINIYNELSLFKMKIDKLLEEGGVDFLLIEGESLSGKSYLINELLSMCKIASIPTYRIDAERDPTALNLASCLMKNTGIDINQPEEADFNKTERKISLFESTRLLIDNNKPFVVTIDNIDKAKDEFIEFLAYIVKRSSSSKRNGSLFVLTYKRWSNKNKFINSIDELGQEKESILTISIKPFSRLEISNILSSNFKREFSVEALDYIFSNSFGLRGKLINIVDYFIKNNFLVINKQNNNIDLSNSFYKQKKRGGAYESKDEMAILVIISFFPDGILKKRVGAIFSKIKTNEEKLEKIIESLINKEFIKKNIDTYEYYINNKYISTLYYKLMDDGQRKNIHAAIANQLEGDNLTFGILQTISNHFLLAEIYNKSFFYFVKLAELAITHGLLNDASSYYDELIPFFTKLTNENRAQLLFLRSKLFIDDNKLDLATTEIDKLEKLFYEERDIVTESPLLCQTYQIRISYLKGRIAIKRGEIKEGFNIIDNAIYQLRNGTVDSFYVEMLILKGGALLSLARYNEIILEKEKMFALSVQVEFKAQRARLVNIIALAYYYTGKLSEAEEILKGILESLDELNGKSAKLRVLNVFGMVLHQSSRFVEALQYYEEALKIATSHNDIIYKATILNNLAGTCQAMGNFKKSILLLDTAASIYKELGMPAAYENILYSRAFLLSNIGLFNESLELLEKGEKLAKKREKQIVMGYSLALRGDIARTMQRCDDAINYYNQAISLFKKYNLNKELCTTYIAKAETLLEFGKEIDAEQAINDANKMKDVISYPDIKPRLSLAMINLFLLQNPIKYALIHEYFETIRENLVLFSNWELKLRYLKLNSLYERMLGHYDESLSTIGELKSEMERIISDCPPTYVAAFFQKSEFGRFLSSYEKKYVKKSMVERILEINLEISGNLNIDLLLSKILTNIVVLTDCDLASVILKENDDKISVISALDRDCKVIKREIEDFKISLFKEAIKDKRERIEKSENIANIILPLIVRDKSIGILYIKERENKNLEDRIDIKLLRLFAVQAAIAIDNARTHEVLMKKNISLSDEKFGMESELSHKSFYLDLYERRLTDTYGEIIGKSPKITSILAELEKISRSEISVLIQGESGTGKELIARAIHSSSRRNKMPFISENCAAFSENLLESELFGYKKGSFTGAVENRRGIFEMADRGTVFLDEIGEMSENMQKKLLRLLESGEIRRVGEESTRRVDIRLVSATNRNIQKTVNDKLFREDLYYRINGLTINLPPLRERKEDIHALTEYFIKKRHEKSSETISIDDGVVELFMNYDWPGNIRELKNEIERLIVMSDGGKISVEQLANDPRFFKTKVLGQF